MLLIDIKYPRKATRENGGSEYQRAKTPFALDGAKIDFNRERLGMSSKRPPFGPRGGRGFQPAVTRIFRSVQTAAGRAPSARPLGRSRIAGLEEKRAAVIVRPVLERES